MNSVLLLSGGLDSTCIAVWRRPAKCLGIDYGQKSAVAEERAARAVASHLNLPFHHIKVDASEVGGGLMAREATIMGSQPEWWPYRNQLLITLAAAWAISHDCADILVGTVAGDGDRHADGTAAFYSAMTKVLESQEGQIRVSAPAIRFDTPALIETSGVDEATLGWTHSCHVDDIPCGACPGCIKRAEVLAQVDMLQ